MKKAIYLLLVSMLFVTACTEQAPRIAKYTDLYAVKGTDSLFLDRYTAVSVEQDDARPCLVFVFGGGFIAGERDAEKPVCRKTRQEYAYPFPTKVRD